jgi:hypothetical protein
VCFCLKNSERALTPNYLDGRTGKISGLTPLIFVDESFFY